MAKQTEKELISFGDKLFSKQANLLSLFQTLAEHFYPERADFTLVRNIGDEIADYLVDSYPVLARRDLANSFSSMLRDGDWYKMSVKGETDYVGESWLEWATKRLKGFMSDRESGFVRSTKEGDHDFATFGQTVISVEMNKKRNGLLYRCWHLKDCAWFEDETGQVSGVIRKWNPTINDLARQFGAGKLHSNIVEKLEKHPFKEATIRHMVIPSDMYRDETIKTPYVSIYLDVENNHIIEAIGINHKYYVVPRFQTISGSQYAYSPATIVALPNGRTLQAMTHTLLEAGERYARPPIIATQKAIRSDVDLSPDGVTWVDDEYDERLGTSLRTLPQDRGGFPIGLEMRDGVYEIITSAFYLNKITLPSDGREMTAYEVQERMKQYRRENLPLFAPMESDYNGQLCEISFEVAMQGNLLGSVHDIPDSLREKDVEFKFTSPLSESEEEQRANKFDRVSDMLARAANIDQSSADNVDFDQAIRDAIKGIGVPSTWLRSTDDVIEDRKAQLAQQMIEQQVAQE